MVDGRDRSGYHREPARHSEPDDHRPAHRVPAWKGNPIMERGWGGDIGPFEGSAHDVVLTISAEVVDAGTGIENTVGWRA